MTTAVQGTVLRAPVCPNEPSDAPCPATPVEGAEVEILSGSRTVAHTTTDSRGHFTVQVTAGRYRVTASFRGGVPPSRTTATVEVGAEPVHLKLDLDSGIR